MNYDDPDIEQPLQPIKKIDDEVLDRFVNTYGFKREIKKDPLNIASASKGNNIFIIRKTRTNKNGNNNYSFSIIDKDNFDIYKEEEKKEKKSEDFTFKFIDFDTNYFKDNEQKFIKSIKENKMFDDENVKDGYYEDFKDRTVQQFIKHPFESIHVLDPMKIPDIQDEPEEPIPEKKDEEELMGDDDEEEEEKERMIDEEEEEKQRKELEERKRKIKEEEEKPDAFEDNQVFLANEYDEEKEPSDDERELFKQAKKMNDRQLNNQLVQYKQDFNLKPQRKGNRGKMPKEHSRFFNELRGKYGFTLNNEGSNAGQAYLRVGNDVIFVKRLTNNTPGYSKYRDKGDDRNKDKNFMIAIVNKSDFPKLDSDNEDVKARFFNFSLDYYNKNKDKFSDAIEDKKFIFDQDLEKINDDYNFEDYFLNKERLEKLKIIPKNFNYRKIFSNNNQNNQLFAGHTPEGEELRTLIKYNNNSDSLLKLIVSLSENNKGEVDFKEIGEIQDINSDLTNLYSDMQELKSKINSSNNAEEKERLLIKYNEKRLKFEDLVKKYSKEAYRLSTLNKKKKATFSNPKYIKNKLNRL